VTAVVQIPTFPPVGAASFPVPERLKLVERVVHDIIEMYTAVIPNRDPRSVIGSFDDVSDLMVQVTELKALPLRPLFESQQ